MPTTPARDLLLLSSLAPFLANKQLTHDKLQHTQCCNSIMLKSHRNILRAIANYDYYMTSTASPIALTGPRLGFIFFNGHLKNYTINVSVLIFQTPIGPIPLIVLIILTWWKQPIKENKCQILQLLQHKSSIKRGGYRPLLYKLETMNI